VKEQLSGFADTTFRSLRVRNYRLFFGGQLVSLCGTWMQTIAQSWLVLQLSHNGTVVGIVFGLQTLPTLLFGVWGGVIADRFDKRRVLVVTQSAMALTAAVLATLTLSGVVTLWMVIVVALCLGCAQAVDNPTRQAFAAEMVAAPELPNAIALNSATFQMSRIIGPAIAGVLIVAVGTGTCFLLNAVSFLAVIGALLTMRPGELYRSEPVAPARGQIREGLRYVWATPALRNVLAITAVVGTLAINFPVVLPLVAQRTFHGDAGTYSLMTVGMGAGALFGALYIASRADTTAKQVLVTCVGFGVAICVASAAPTYPSFLVVMLFMGAGQITFLASCNSTLQLRSDPVLRGRVMAVYMITLLGSTPIGGPIVGWVSQQFGPRWGLAVGGVATLFTAATFGVALVRAGRRRPAAEAPAVRPGVSVASR